MAYARARRHYRVAENEVKNETKNGVFIPEDKKMQILLIGIGIILLIFVKGLLIGYFCGTKHND